ncbi:class I SAM-dependent methyltransferase [Bacillus clarus]|uniref:Class I SAM-dependent methyltransferase n=1 Tax=Bacillus clarus TaxID=2338372 RepID=A0A090Z5M6_9BACI|nr:class I SAM-dependent methyltransferase [Bacillus clarus]KFM99675.1 methyltransferase domain protein [Bacillus clarus]RFT68548.1 class I SAM-dependent methyltransferase [Bacillus clarus]
MNWVTHTPSFEFDNLSHIIRTNSAWSGHLNFAYDLVRFHQPEKVVELGTLLGASFFSFCQGIKDGGLSAKCFAVDTWIGDGHTGPYGEGVFQIVKKVTNYHYPNIGTLIRSTFDDAVSRFEDETIDILHIDGYHTYEAVSHDYETWLPKVADNGIVLFHDIAVTTGDFGVYKLWDEVKVRYPHLQFEHSYGLGVLFPKGCSDKFVEILNNKNEIQNMYR